MTRRVSAYFRNLFNKRTVEGLEGLLARSLCAAVGLLGTVVGDRAVIGASSLASSCVEADTTVLGVPGRIIYRKGVL